MDLQKFVDGFELTTCIISVERFPDGSYGNIRIVAGNKAYIDSIEDPRNGAAAHMLDNKFIPGSPYERYIPKDLNFEQTCYRCAFLKGPYIHISSPSALPAGSISTSCPWHRTILI